MDENAREKAKAKLSGLILKVLEDGVVDASEREALAAFFKEALLTVADVKAVYLSCVSDLQNEVLADGVVTEAEAQRCRLVVEQLRIPLRLLPPEMVQIVSGLPLT